MSNIIVQSAINSLGTVVIAASSAAFNIEVFAYDVLNSFSQACTTFVGQNYGAGQLERCKKVLALSLMEDMIASALAVLLVLLTGKAFISVFNNDPKVIEVGYTRLMMVFSAYVFSMLYEILSGYLRGFGISFVPALLTILGVCGVRVFWVEVIFPMNRTFKTLLTSYPVSLATTAVFILAALIYYRPAYRFVHDSK